MQREEMMKSQTEENFDDLNQFVELNVGGTVFTTTIRTLTQPIIAEKESDSSQTDTDTNEDSHNKTTLLTVKEKLKKKKKLP